ncbi:baseplate wedge subunit [Pectobacterium bacteriophage PM2]|uniref:Baseplate wedge protein gp10 n=1 Tax=Pectobacterium bacteriophage PM2 TaxID=1429794 RepID=A0A0A0Q0J0_9CAUD|nr:baseplate wedge subunit [Pectobacterium bacteriophage PM2]AHY25141.1 baseplate wedge subunit and tail pin [Pectobacterium bacteriophage PM2]
MKQDIKIGSVVDDGSGDYLRQGGIKINDNFDELYYQLGDGNFPHAAGAWKKWSTTDGAILEADFGKSYAVDTTSGRVTVHLPKGTISEYNFVIRLRDVYSTWQRSPVTIIPAVGDTIKGATTPVEINRNFADLELVYCSPGRWEYIKNKSIDRIDNNDIATVATQEYIATQGQTDFMNVFPAHGYNPVNLKVYHRGNLLFYGSENIFDPVNAEVGSPGPNGTLVAYDGINIKLRNQCNAGDTVIVVSYMDGLGQWRSSYNRREIRLLDSRYTDKTSVNGSVIVADLSTKLEFTLEELGVTSLQPVNPNACELYVNSILQYQAGTAGLPEFRCENGFGDDVESCVNSGGNWIPSATDFRFILGPSNILIESVQFDKPFDSGDVITLVWYNNNIGTTLELDEILSNTNDLYVASQNYLDISGNVRITDYDNPFWPNVDYVDATENKISSVASIFDIIHPIGSVYENTVNPNNPRTYMGFGMWKRLEGNVLVGWESTPGSRFNLNNNYKDSLGNEQPYAGGTGGSGYISLEPNNIPNLSTDDTVLIADDNGPIIIGGCQFDPDAQGPAYTKYRESKATINKDIGDAGNEFDSMNPYLVVYRWVRIS